MTLEEIVEKLNSILEMTYPIHSNLYDVGSI